MKTAPVSIRKLTMDLSTNNLARAEQVFNFLTLYPDRGRLTDGCPENMMGAMARASDMLRRNSNTLPEGVRMTHHLVAGSTYSRAAEEFVWDHQRWVKRFADLIEREV